MVAKEMKREQAKLIEDQRTENSVHREKLKRIRILVSDDQRRRMAVEVRILGQKRRSEVGTPLTPVMVIPVSD